MSTLPSPWLLALGALSALGACVPASPSSLADAERLHDPRVTTLVAQGHLALDLGAGRDDDSVVADARQLIGSALEIPALDFDAGHHITLAYLGKGRSGPRPAEDDARDTAPTDREPGAELEGVDAFNLATGNEFRLVFAGGLLDAIAQYDAERGLDRGTEAVDEEALLAPRVPVNFSISNDDDDRYRLYGVNADVTNVVHQRLVQLGSGCSGTLVGPRHVVTAGHCLWNRTTQRWSDDFWVRAGANGNSEVAQVFLNANSVPAGQVVWYYTPSQFRSTTGSTWGFDYGILVIPARLGDQVGWMGRVSYTSGSLQSAYLYRRGYPACSATSGGEARIDVPSPCNANHIYANAADCSVGEFESLDSDNWSRIVHHSCDASGGDSGSPLYVYYDGTASVAAVHFFSECEKTATDVACSGALDDRPLAALRLTPQYRDLIGTFRSMFP